MSDVIICRCQEVTEIEIQEAIKDGAQSISGVKRRTGACMGLCQGRTCQKMILGMIAQYSGKSLADLQPATTRIPVRPVKIDSLV